MLVDVLDMYLTFFSNFYMWWLNAPTLPYGYRIEHTVCLDFIRIYVLCGLVVDLALPGRFNGLCCDSTSPWCSRLLRFSVLSASPITLVCIFWSLCDILLCVLSWCRVRVLLDGATAFPAGRSIVYYGSCSSRIAYCGASQNIYDDISFGLPHLGESFGHAHRALLMYSAEELPASLLWETVQTTAICLP